MNKTYFNTNAQTACEMLEVTDKDILEWSNGEVTSSELFNEDGSLDTSEGTLFSKEIFGEPLEETTKMGHIVLPIPVVNPQYVRGKRPILPNLLGLDRKTVEDLIHYLCWYNKETKEIIPIKDLTRELEEICVAGGTAIEMIMKDKGLNTDHIILHTIPVIPSALRIRKINCPEHDGAFVLNGVNYLYRRVLSHVEEFPRLECCPYIYATSEKMEFEWFVAALISNGMYLEPVLAGNGIAFLSLEDIAEEISKVSFRKAGDSFENAINRCVKNSPVNGTILLDKVTKLLDMKRTYHDELWKALDLGEGDSVSEKTIKEHPLTISYKEKYVPLENEIYDDVIGIAEVVFKEMFSDYSEYKEQFFISARNAINNYLEIYPKCTSPENFLEHIVVVAYESMRNLKEKRVQWINFDNYEFRKMED